MRGQAGIFSQELLDALLVAGGGGDGDVIGRSPRKQVSDHHPFVSKRGMGLAAGGTVPVVAAVHREQRRSLPVGASRVDRRSQLEESIDQAQLPGYDAPVERSVAERIA